MGPVGRLRVDLSLTTIRTSDAGQTGSVVPRRACNTRLKAHKKNCSSVRSRHVSSGAGTGQEHPSCRHIDILPPSTTGPSSWDADGSPFPSRAAGRLSFRSTDGGDGIAPSGLRVRSQGTGAARRGQANHRADQRKTLDRPFRHLEQKASCCSLLHLLSGGADVSPVNCEAYCAQPPDLRSYYQAFSSSSGPENPPPMRWPK